MKRSIQNTALAILPGAAGVADPQAAQCKKGDGKCGCRADMQKDGCCKHKEGT